VKILSVLSTLLGVMNVIQFLATIASGSTLRVKAQSDYNNWYRVAEIADQIIENPSKAAELIHTVRGIADAERNQIKAYSREKLGFVPWFDPASQGGPKDPQSVGFWRLVKSAFVPM
jgi:hypothetical protein